MLHNRSIWKSIVTYATNYNLILWVCLAGNRVGKFVGKLELYFETYVDIANKIGSHEV